MADIDKLARLMQSLPQEIFDKKYRQTFEVPRWPDLIEARKIPFNLLHVDSSSRREVAAAFYSNASIVDYIPTPSTYLSGIPHHHRILIGEVFWPWTQDNCTKYNMAHRSMAPQFMQSGTVVR